MMHYSAVAVDLLQIREIHQSYILIHVLQLMTWKGKIKTFMAIIKKWRNPNERPTPKTEVGRKLTSNASPSKTTLAFKTVLTIPLFINDNCPRIIEIFYKKKKKKKKKKNNIKLLFYSHLQLKDRKP